uniref:Uncharacterized protein n=1 Tax=Tanacetum cinerariifolium TaxID=118510 RepID=A0A699IB77_TANCI|nr:hypothetical protein [Tanacetum cinerariifolium]
MAEKEKNYVWGHSFEAFPPQFMLSYSSYSLCMMRNSLIQANVNPVDNIYSQLPPTLLQNHRFNLLHNRKGHLVHSKRQLDGRKASGYTKISNFRAKLKPIGNPVKVCGKNGREVGSRRITLKVCPLPRLLFRRRFRLHRHHNGVREGFEGVFCLGFWIVKS